MRVGRWLTAARAGVLVVAIVSPGSASALELEPAVVGEIDAVFSEYTARPSPGCSLGVVDDGELVLARGYGMANLEHGVALGRESVFRIGSTSKQLTAAVILLLEQQGKLSRDDDVRDFLPELRDYGTPVTLRHLIHHTSGYRDYLTLQFLAGRDDRDWYSEEEVVELLARQRELNFPPGSEQLYSNSGYFLLSQVVERATGRPLREVAAELVFQPLEMSASHFHDDANQVVPSRAYGYAADGEGGFRVSQTQLDMVGDGGVFTTVDDLARWDRNFYLPEVGGPELVAAMLERGVLTSGETLDYASGLGHAVYRGAPVVQHGGAFVGYRAQMMRFPEAKLTIICLCNFASANPTELSRRVADVLLAAELEPLASSSEKAAAEDGEEGEEAEESAVDESEEPAAETARPGEPAGKAKSVSEDDQAPVDFAGRYLSEELAVEYRLSVSGDELQLAFGRHEPRTLRWVEQDCWRGGPLELRFRRGAQGRVEGFELDAGRVKNLDFVRAAPRRP